MTIRRPVQAVLLGLTLCAASPLAAQTVEPAAVGGTLGVATGVHLGNDRKGSLLLDMLTGAGVWGVGIGTAALTGWDDTATLIAAIGVPIAQLFATVAVERSTGRSREARRSLEISAGPDLQGGVTIVASLRF